MSNSFFDDGDEDSTSQLNAPDSLSVNYGGGGGAGPSSEAGGHGTSSAAGYNTSSSRNISSRHSHAGAVDTSSVAGGGGRFARGRSPDELDEILAGMEVDHHEGVEGIGGLKLHQERSVVRLQRALSNEQGAPELLEFPRLLVEGVVRDLAARNSLVREAQDTHGQEEQFYIATDLVAVENMRAAWVLKQFTRWRLFKLEQHAQYYIDEITDSLDAGLPEPTRLYHNEKEFAIGLIRIMDEYQTEAAMGAMPEKIVAQPKPVSSPDFSQAVFVRARKDCPPIVLPDGTTMEIEKGSQHMFRYSTVRDLLSKDLVEII